MKNTMWASDVDKQTTLALNKCGFYTNKDFDDIPVIALLLMSAVEKEEVDDVLKALYFEENRWRIGIKDIILAASEKQGNQYLADIFNDYSFDKFPSSFYGMTVRELLDLDFIEERYIPYVTSLMMRFIRDSVEEFFPGFFFTSRDNIKETFWDIWRDILEFGFNDYGIEDYSSDNDFNDYYPEEDEG